MSPEFLDVEDVLEIHAIQLAAFGGDPGIRDRGRLDAAVNGPMATFGGEFLLADLVPSPENDRIYKPVSPDDPTTAELAESIRRHGPSTR